VSAVFSPQVSADALDRFPDLTDKAVRAVVTLKGRDELNSEYFYDVSVKTLSSDSLAGESLVIVLGKIVNINGSEWIVGTSESNLTRMEILGQDGETNDGQPYFRIRRGFGPDPASYTESSPVSVWIGKKDYLIVFTMVFSCVWNETLACFVKREEADLAIVFCDDTHRQADPTAHPERCALSRRRVGALSVENPHRRGNP